MRKTKEVMQKTVNDLKKFMWLSVNSTAPSLERINMAIKQLILLVKGDILAIRETIGVLWKVYKSNYDTYVEGLQYLQSILKSMGEHYNHSFYVLKTRNVDWGHGFVSFGETYLTNIVDMQFSVADAAIQGMHVRLTADLDEWEECKRKMVNVSEKAREILSGSYNSENDDDFSAYMIFDNLRGNRFECINDLSKQFHMALRTLDKLAIEIDQLFTSYAFNYEKIAVTVGEKIDYLENLTIRLIRGMAAYANNETTKLDLSNKIGSRTLADVTELVNAILNVIDLNAINMLLSRTDALTQHVIRWYITGLESIGKLGLYFDSHMIENNMRSLHIWRDPVVRLDMANILNLKYDLGESWKTWSSEISLSELLMHRLFVGIITGIAERYKDILRKELLEIKADYVLSIDQITNSLKRLAEDYESMRGESLMDDNFVRYVSILYGVFQNKTIELPLSPIGLVVFNFSSHTSCPVPSWPVYPFFSHGRHRRRWVLSFSIRPSVCLSGRLSRRPFRQRYRSNSLRISAIDLKGQARIMKPKVGEKLCLWSFVIQVLYFKIMLMLVSNRKAWK